MKYPKLYIKNERGRYEEYKVPDMDVSEVNKIKRAMDD